MDISLKQFVERLTQSGLMAAEDIEAFQNSIPPNYRPQDAQSLAYELVRAKKLTKYQAAAVYQGATEGLVLGEYTVLKCIGAGGMGVVVKAQHRRMKRDVAIKMLPTATMKSQDTIDRFYREVEAAARLVHVNIVTAFDAGEQEGIHYLVMEFVNGRDLAHILKKNGPLPVGQTISWIIQAALGLKYAHEQGVIHRDIKPGNLLIDKKNGRVKLLDMGLARMDEAIDPDVERITSVGQVLGTCDYMAPEQAEDLHSADHRADIYALGCTMFRLLTGELPYPGQTVIQILLGHRESPIPSMRVHRSKVSEKLDAVFKKMVAKKREDRYQSMDEVIADLGTCLAAYKRQSASDDEAAMTSSISQKVFQADSDSKPTSRGIAEETIDYMTDSDEETGSDILRRTQRSRRRKKLLIGIGLAVLVVLVGLAIRLAFD